MAKGIRRIAGGWQIRFNHAGKSYCKTFGSPDTAAGLKSATKERDRWIESVAQGRIPDKFLEHVENFYIAWIRPHLNSWRISYNEDVLAKYGGTLRGYSVPAEARVVRGPSRIRAKQ